MCHHYESDDVSEREPAYELEDDVDEEDVDLEEEDEVDPAVPPADD